MANTPADITQYTVKKKYTRFACPGCKELINTELADAGKPDTCPCCRFQFVSPGLRELIDLQKKQELVEQEQLRLEQARKAARRRAWELAERVKAQREEELQQTEEAQREEELQQARKAQRAERLTCPVCKSVCFAPEGTTERIKCDNCDSVFFAHLGRESRPMQPQQTIVRSPNKSAVRSKSVAAVLALLFGSVGAHKFYLGEAWAGLLYVAICWTGIPTIIGILEAASLSMMDDSAFDQWYNR